MERRRRKVGGSVFCVGYSGHPHVVTCWLNEFGFMRLELSEQTDISLFMRGAKNLEEIGYSFNGFFLNMSHF